MEQDIHYLDTETRGLSRACVSDFDARRSTEWVTDCRLHIVLTVGLVEDRFGNKSGPGVRVNKRRKHEAMEPVY